MYPYIYHDEVLQFEDMGIVETGNVKIQWPESRIRKGAPPVADIQLDDTCAAVVMDKYRGKEYIFATLSNGIKVRCGYSLENKIKTWLDKYDDDCAPYMKFTTVDVRTVRGFKDIIIK
ncbi:hypothetical protein BGZ59_003586 [Podila verticillata]|nr:hypothetical protein BGZ59_003586 [Podila verticillata]